MGMRGTREERACLESGERGGVCVCVYHPHPYNLFFCTLSFSTTRRPPLLPGTALTTHRPPLTAPFIRPDARAPTTRCTTAVEGG